MAALVGFLRRNDGQRRRLPRPRIFRDRLNPLEMRTDDELFERYRFRRPTIIFICDMIADTVSHGTRRSMALPPMIQLLVFLRFVATGAFPPAYRRRSARFEGHGWTMYPESGLCHRRRCRKIHPLSNRTRGLKCKKEISCHRRISKCARMCILHFHQDSNAY